MSTMLSERSQIQENTYCRIPFIEVQEHPRLTFDEKSQIVFGVGHRAVTGS